MNDIHESVQIKNIRCVIVVVLTIFWFALCLVPIVWLVSHHNYQENSELGTGFLAMMHTVTFPSGLVSNLIIVIFSPVIGDEYDVSSSWLWVRWAIFSLVGYIQWVVIITVIRGLIRKRARPL